MHEVRMDAEESRHQQPLGFSKQDPPLRTITGESGAIVTPGKEPIDKVAAILRMIISMNQECKRILVFPGCVPI